MNIVTQRKLRMVLYKFNCVEMHDALLSTMIT